MVQGSVRGLSVIFTGITFAVYLHVNFSNHCFFLNKSYPEHTLSRKASTLWAFKVKEKMQILPLHIKSIVNLNFTRAHESTSPKACTDHADAAVGCPAGFINIYIFSSLCFQMIQDARAKVHASKLKWYISCF